ncbi:prenyltransferase [Fusobacterium sp.]|uniref:prenyltransferase n=1 Tax=Fusobacterium sp. TaxID=68766 RepID=UPI00396C39E7
MKTYDKITFKMAINLAAPHTWVASVIPACFGIIFCKLYKLHLTLSQSILLVLACILMQSSVNTLNDYVDFVKGNDSSQDNVEASDAVLVYNNINPQTVVTLGIVYLIAGSLSGTIASLNSTMIPFFIGITGAVIVILYSCGGPFSISYLPFGEVVSGFVMGILIPLGIASVSDGKIHFQIFVLALPLFLGIALIMMTNNGCDIEKDRKGKRYTLPVIIGRKKTRKLYHTLIIIWILLIIELSIMQFKTTGILVLIPLIAGRKIFQELLKSQLEPEKRVEQMKRIVLGNIVGNGSYIIVMLINIFMR